MRCDREAYGDRADGRGPCPAYPEHGMHCVRVAGTLCGGSVQGTFASKEYSCLRCPFYNSAHYDKRYTDLKTRDVLRASAMMRSIMKCWEFMSCGREKGGNKSGELGICPAYPDHGRHCARIAGTLCGGKVQGRFAAKLMDCIECAFYKSIHYDKHYSGFVRSGESTRVQDFLPVREREDS